MARLSRNRTQPTFGTPTSAQRRFSRRTRPAGPPTIRKPSCRPALRQVGRRWVRPRNCARPGRDRAGPAAGRSGCRRPATGAPPGPRSVADTARRSSGRPCGRRCRSSWPAPAPGSRRTGPARSARATRSPAPASGTGGTGTPAQSLGRVRQSGGPGIPPRPERRGFQPGLSVSTPTSAAPITGAGPGPADAITAARALTPALAARAERHDRDGSFPVEDFADIRTAGLLGVMVPARLGGVGAGFADYAEVAMALGTGNGATALVFNMHASVTGALAGTPEDLARALGVPA